MDHHTYVGGRNKASKGRKKATSRREEVRNVMTCVTYFAAERIQSLLISLSLQGNSVCGDIAREIALRSFSRFGARRRRTGFERTHPKVFFRAVKNIPQKSERGDI